MVIDLHLFCVIERIALNSLNAFLHPGHSLQLLTQHFHAPRWLLCFLVINAKQNVFGQFTLYCHLDNWMTDVYASRLQLPEYSFGTFNKGCQALLFDAEGNDFNSSCRSRVTTSLLPNFCFSRSTIIL